MKNKLKNSLNNNAYVYLFKRTWYYIDANIFLVQKTWKYLGKGRFRFIVSVLCGLIAETVMLSSTYFLGKALNAIQTQGNAGLKNFFIFLMFILVARVVFWIFHWTERYLESISSYIVKRNVIESLYDKVAHLPLKWHKENHSGRIIHEINTSSEGLSTFVTYNFENIGMVVNFFGAIVILSFLGRSLGIFAGVIGVILFILSITFNRRVVRYKRERLRAENNVAALLKDYLVNITTVISLRIEQLTKKELHNNLEPILIPEKKRAAYNETKWFINDVIVVLMKCFLTFYYALQIVLKGGILLVGNISMVFNYLSNVEKAFATFNTKYGDAVAFKADVEAVDHIIHDYDAYKQNNLIIDESFIEPAWDEINIQSLNFNYTNASGLKNISMNIKRGQRIAIVGESGSGKSTFLKILRGLETTQDCQITVNNAHENHLNNAKFLSSIITYIPQEPEIFENTIEHNITFGFDISDTEMKTIIELACFENVLDQLPNGVKTMINEKGVNLSGGEKQRLALARGLFFAKNSDIILLDEPTSSIDYKNEVQIYKNILKHFKEKTIISVIHKFYLLDMFDYIYLFDNGRIIGEGTYKELSENEIFKKLSYKFSKEVKN